MTDLASLTTEELRIVRDDRSALTDGIYRIIDQPIDEFSVRSKLFAYMSEQTLAATHEVLNRLLQRQESKEDGA
ncbi:hypothetical protein [Microbacterium sp. H6]|uniref:hypothetical protein n=1 Tax=Microbacterium sp. H6 TaxID=421122 RepID=UPI000DE4089C|nr:hypothetical protein [Microbacterium sp. H6]RBO73482.1 hypothetical protein DSP71_04825 [Microbacterium sp. H6]